jgi:DNA processing protein
MQLSTMACPQCQRRAALIAALAPAITSLLLHRDDLLGLLGLADEQLIRAAKVENPRALLRRLQPPATSESVPSAICRHDPDYPEALAQLPCAPAVLYATCTTERLRKLLTAPTVAIVGDPRYSGYAHQITFALAHDLAAAGVTVISGLRQGLDEIAHQGALHAEGQTVAVMPCAPERCRPLPNEHLHQCICERGAAISEFPPGSSAPQRWCFIARQRIIAALASVVVIVEAERRSSALLTAQIAAELGHEVAVVPGRLTDAGGVGTFGLLRDGATPVGCAQHVIDLFPAVHTSEHRAQRLAA